jgi:hypothetical protein
MSEENEFSDDLINDAPEPGELTIMEDEEDETTAVRTVLLVKDDLLALLGLKTSRSGGLIVRIDPRQPLPVAQKYGDVAAATRWFKRSLMTSKRNGWTVIHDGQPLYG